MDKFFLQLSIVCFSLFLVSSCSSKIKQEFKVLEANNTFKENVLKPGCGEEHCSCLQSWIVQNDVTLYKSPDENSTKVALVKKNEKFSAIEFYRFVSKFGLGKKDNKPFIILDYGGEGSWKVTFDGKTVDYLYFEKDIVISKPVSQNWLKMTTNDGTQGWTKYGSDIIVTRPGGCINI